MAGDRYVCFASVTCALGEAHVLTVTQFPGDVTHGELMLQCLESSLNYEKGPDTDKTARLALSLFACRREFTRLPPEDMESSGGLRSCVPPWGTLTVM